MMRLVLSCVLGEASQKVRRPKLQTRDRRRLPPLRPSRHLSILYDYKNNPLHFRSRDREVAMSSPTKSERGYLSAC